MATYYYQARARASTVDSESSISISTSASAVHISPIATDSAYVFPAPSSSISHSPSPPPSAHSDVSFSVLASPFSPTQSHRDSWSHVRDSDVSFVRSPLSSMAGETDVDGVERSERWQWPSRPGTVSEEEMAELDEAVERISRWTSVSGRHSARAIIAPRSPSIPASDLNMIDSAEMQTIRQPHLKSSLAEAQRQTFALTGNNHLSTGTSSCSPAPSKAPSLHIPLLSFFAFLIPSSESSILHTLMYPQPLTCASALFPGHCLDPDPTLYDHPASDTLDWEYAYYYERPRPLWPFRANQGSEELKMLREGLRAVVDVSFGSSLYLVSRALPDLVGTLGEMWTPDVGGKV